MNSSDFRFALGDRIRDARKDKGLSQAELSDALKEEGLNVSRESISKWENMGNVGNEGRRIDAEYIVILARVLGVSTEELLTGDKPEYIGAIEATGLSTKSIENLKGIQTAMIPYFEAMGLDAEKANTFFSLASLRGLLEAWAAFESAVLISMACTHDIKPYNFNNSDLDYKRYMVFRAVQSMMNEYEEKIRGLNS